MDGSIEAPLLHLNTIVMKEYEVWMEGYAATGESEKAFQLVNPERSNKKWKGISFEQACIYMHLIN